MYSNIVQDILNSVYGRGGQDQQQSHPNLASSLKNDAWNDALYNASGGLAGRAKPPLLPPQTNVTQNQNQNQNTARPPAAPVAPTAPTGNTGSIAPAGNEDIIDLITSILGGGSQGGGSQGGSTTQPGQGNTLAGGSNGGSRQQFAPPTMSAPRPDREGGMNTGQTGYSGTNVAPGGGFLTSIRYGTRP